MTEHKRSTEDRRFRSGTRSGRDRRENASDDWKFIEKRQKRSGGVSPRADGLAH